MGFTIGEINHTDPVGAWGIKANTSVSLVDKGISIHHFGGYSGGGLGTYTPAQARQLGQLLINAADRWSELNATVKQAEAEIEAVNKTVYSRIKDFLA